jgi:RimJ/RimL family protein N-acetyltransferase
MAWVPDRDEAGSAEVGLLLVVPAQCRGYAAESIAALAEEVFAAPPLQRLWTRHASDNAAATGLMRKLGFQRMEDTTGPAPVRWQLQRQVWATRHPPGFASLPVNC